MFIDTEKLVDLCVSYDVINRELGVIDSDLETQLREPIEQELAKKFGRNIIYHASSLYAVAGIDEIDSMISRGIANPPDLYGTRPHLSPIIYYDTALEHAGLVTSLVFETYDLHYENQDDYPMGIVQLYPYAALPLIEPHKIEAVSFEP